MKKSQRDPQRISYSTLVGSLGLMLLSALAGHAQTPAKPSKDMIRVEIQAGAESEPELANVVLETRNRQQRYEISTNEARRGFWPGRYRLTVTKAGFVPIMQGEQNFGSWNDTIDCTLVRTGAPNFCRIK